MRTESERSSTVPERAEVVPFNKSKSKTEIGTPPTPEGGRGSFKTLIPEMRQLARQAYAVWRDAAAKVANPYSDHSACLLAGRMAVDATRWEDGLVILAAIKTRMDPKSSPRRIPEWARLEGSDQRGKVHAELKNAAKVARDQIVEHNGTLYLGHVPNVVGSTCGLCGGTIKDHLMARRPALRHIGTLLGGLPAAPEKGESIAHLSNQTIATGGSDAN